MPPREYPMNGLPVGWECQDARGLVHVRPCGGEIRRAPGPQKVVRCSGCGAAWELLPVAFSRLRWEPVGGERTLP